MSSLTLFKINHNNVWMEGDDDNEAPRGAPFGKNNMCDMVTKGATHRCRNNIETH